MTLRFIKLVGLVLKHGKDVTGRAAALQSCCEGMFEKVGFRLFLICVYSSDEDGAEMRGRRRCGGRLGHCDRLVSASNSEMDRDLVVDVRSNCVSLEPGIDL